MKKNICVYCGSTNNVSKVYQQAAQDVGSFIAQNNWKLVYGGGSRGLMGIVADSVIHLGGEVIVFIPELLHEKEGPHPNLTELHIVNDMHTRKKGMYDISDAFCVLPGGFGTLDEFFETITWKQLEIHQKPIIILNINNYWDPLIKVVEKIFKEGFAHPQQASYLRFINKVDELGDLFQ